VSISSISRSESSWRTYLACLKSENLGWFSR
jgi:hypothetical protein